MGNDMRQAVGLVLAAAAVAAQVLISAHAGARIRIEGEARRATEVVLSTHDVAADCALMLAAWDGSEVMSEVVHRACR